MLKQNLTLRSILIMLLCLCFTSSYATKTTVTSSQIWSTSQTYDSVVVSGSNTVLTVNAGVLTINGQLHISGGAKVLFTGTSSGWLKAVLATDNNSIFHVKGVRVDITLSLRCENNADMIVENSGNLSAGGFILTGKNNVVDGSTLYSDNEIVLAATDCYLLAKNAANVTARRTVIYATSRLRLENTTFTVRNKGQFDIYVDQINVRKKGGILEVDHATITSLPGETWKFISVAGNSGNGIFMPMHKIFQISDEAARAIFNNAVVENCDSGVVNWNLYQYNGNIQGYDTKGQYTGGGIIQATNTTFRNCKTAVQFSKYLNQNPSMRPINDLSFFKGCKFVLTRQSPFTSHTNMIKMNGVYGIQILGCEFSDINNTLTGAAILADNASFTVNKWCYCTPSYACGAALYGSNCIGGTLYASVFKGMYRAIDVYGAGGTTGINIENIKFLDIKECAVNLNGIFAPIVRNNEILLLDDGTKTEIKGIATGGCSNYTIENNSVAHRGSFSGKTIGILTNNSGPMANVIYWNSLGSTITSTGPLKYALRARGDNRHSTIPSIGLKYMCNSMALNNNNQSYDISVTGLGLLSSKGGVATIQGEISGGTIKSSRNTFTTRSSPTGAHHISNDILLKNISYYYKPVSAETPLYYTTLKTSIQTSSADKQCGSGGGTGMGTGYEHALYEDYVIKKEAIAERLLLVDREACEEDGYCEYDELLTEYVQATDDILYRYLYPTIVYKEIENPVTGETEYYPLDSVSHIDSAKLILEQSAYIHGYKIWLANIYASENDYTSAYATLEDIPHYYTLTDDDIIEIDEVKHLIEVQETLYNGVEWQDLPEETREQIALLALNGNGYPHYMARHFLAMYEAIYLLPEGGLEDDPDEKTTPAANNGSITELNSNEHIKIYPNPATNAIYVDLQGHQGSMLAGIYDVTGKRLSIQSIQAGKENVINVSTLSSGMYLLKILQDGKRIETISFSKQ